MSSEQRTSGAAVTVIDWIKGDHLGLEMPAHAQALREGGEVFLTRAFRAAGFLDENTRVTRITHFEECPGGSTGRKLLLSLEYDRSAPELHTDLFVKFSRDFDDAHRDRARIQMESEVRFALLSRMTGFPIAVPTCCYADYHGETGTGILITQRIAYGERGIERHYEKCLDYEMPQPLEHYQALIRALARLAGAHKAGRLSAKLDEQFPFDPDKLDVSVRSPYTAEQLQTRVKRYADFTAQYPRTLPENIRSPEFIEHLYTEVAQFPQHEAAIKQYLRSAPHLIALCHWNANVDNGWFWRNPEGQLECGLMDWGHASQMNLAMALWGCLAAADETMWNDHLESLLQLFIRELHASGGPALDIHELRLHLFLYIAVMGLAWMLDAPYLILRSAPDLDASVTRRDPRIRDRERARNQLQIMTNFLNLWQRQDFARVLRDFVRRTAG